MMYTFSGWLEEVRKLTLKQIISLTPEQEKQLAEEYEHRYLCSPWDERVPICQIGVVPEISERETMLTNLLRILKEGR